MTDKTGNHKIRPPKLAISRSMIDAGKKKLDELTALDPGLDDEFGITDDLLCAEVFLAMWRVYWEDVMEVQRKKDAGSPIIKFPGAKLIIPH
jgi:hypothetical protein